jgi:hypothetical protein
MGMRARERELVNSFIGIGIPGNTHRLRRVVTDDSSLCRLGRTFFVKPNIKRCLLGFISFSPTYAGYDDDYFP